VIAAKVVEAPRARRSADVIAALCAFVFVVRWFWPAPVGVMLQGLVIGGLTSLIAFGLALTYRSNRIINFAQGDLGGVPASLAVLLILESGVSYFLAFPIAIVAALALGGFVEFVFIRRFRKAPRLILTVVTIGVSQILAGVAFALPRAFGLTTPPQDFPSPFTFEFTIGQTVFHANEVVAMAVVPIVIVALGAFFRYTRIGIAVRASAENADRAALLGVPVMRIQTVVWMIATVLATIAIFLRAGIVGLPLGSVLGPTILIRALAAAVIGRMEKLPTIFVASLALGIVEACIVFSTNAVLVDPVLFLVVLTALLVQRRRNAPRVSEDEQSTWQASRQIRPIPRELSDLPEVVWGARVAKALGVVALVALPLIVNEGQINLAAVVLIFAIVGISLVVLTGWAGQVSLGQVAFVGIGAAVGGYLTATRGWDIAWAVPAAGLAGAFAAMIIGLPALRVRGLYLAVVTLAFALATSSYFLDPDFIHWVPTTAQRIARPELFGQVSLYSETRMYEFVVVIFLLSIWLTNGLRRSRAGRVLIAVRENPRAAQSYGVNATAAKLMAFAFAGFLAAVAGAVFVHHQTGLGNSAYTVDQSRRAFIMVVIGGLGSIPGAVLGSVFIQGVDYFRSSFPQSIQPYLGFLTSGVGLIFVLLALPGGFSQVFYSLRDRFLRAVAERRGIHVPSLIADSRQPDASEDTAPVPVTAAFTPAPAGRALLSVRDLDVGYDGVQVLFGVNCDIGEGEIVALLGTNGAGKSTLLKAISGLLRPTNGMVLFDGEDITAASAQRVAASGIVQVPGGKGVFTSLSVEENLKIAGWLYAKETDYIREATEQVLTFFPVLRDRWEQPAGNLSGGEQQMLTLSQAFIARPRLLMIDELSLGLAPVIVEQLLDIVRAIRDRGTTIVLVEQSVNVALTVAETAFFMEKGEIRFSGATSELLDRPDILRSVFLEGAASMNGNGNGARAKRRASPKREIGGVVLETRDVMRRYGALTAVNDVSLQLREGEILGIIGPNGAGKTTLFDLISGFVVPDSGEVLLHDLDVTALSPDARARLGLGRSFQDARLFPALTVRETIALSLERHVDVRDPVASALHLPAALDSEAAITERVDQLIDLMGVGAFADKFVSELSTGSRRIVDLACIVAHEPSVILFDEPSSGIAQRETEALGPLLLRIRDTTGASLLVIEHDMPLITSISDRLLALDLGAVVVDGKPGKVTKHPAVVASYLGNTQSVIARSGAK
jgi:ABC-type branched-subunit amino acid transport system ATPase component/ABC-type branched-subunit amino acid transport system permease subunit